MSLEYPFAQGKRSRILRVICLEFGGLSPNFGGPGGKILLNCDRLQGSKQGEARSPSVKMIEVLAFFKSFL
ncbi:MULTISPECIES: hypothetical protein [Spirulina sp. CCY15215]|uniref:hypothetical protein n=1 Tax=Spirulina sp. CCY15215 TaxID=2767591 RepID=UPI00194F11B3|nr:hypothetical protein [Spirulina major]